jgi:hypothetical protein
METMYVHIEMCMYHIAVVLQTLSEFYHHEEIYSSFSKSDLIFWSK